MRVAYSQHKLIFPVSLPVCRATDPAALRVLSRHTRLGVPLPPRDATRCGALLSTLSQVQGSYKVYARKEPTAVDSEAHDC